MVALTFILQQHVQRAAIQRLEGPPPSHPLLLICPETPGTRGCGFVCLSPCSSPGCQSFFSLLWPAPSEHPGRVSQHREGSEADPSLNSLVSGFFLTPQRRPGVTAFSALPAKCKGLSPHQAGAAALSAGGRPGREDPQPSVEIQMRSPLNPHPIAGWLVVLCCLEVLGSQWLKNFSPQKRPAASSESSFHLTGCCKEGDTTTSAGLNDPQGHRAPLSPLVDMGF